jgi:hypothetical protein
MLLSITEAYSDDCPLLSTPLRMLPTTIVLSSPTNSYEKLANLRSDFLMERRVRTLLSCGSS